MRIRRPIAALFTALALVGGGASLTACEAAGQDQNDGTTDDSGDTEGGDDADEDLPDNTDPEDEGDEDSQSPD